MSTMQLLWFFFVGSFTCGGAVLAIYGIGLITSGVIFGGIGFVIVGVLAALIGGHGLYEDFLR